METYIFVLLCILCIENIARFFLIAKGEPYDAPTQTTKIFEFFVGLGFIWWGTYLLIQ